MSLRQRAKSSVAGCAGRRSVKSKPSHLHSSSDELSRAPGALGTMSFKVTVGTKQISPFFTAFAR
eukprot:5743245-Alexandrium_andersonii.AAC.1